MAQLLLGILAKFARKGTAAPLTFIGEPIVLAPQTKAEGRCEVQFLIFFTSLFQSFPQGGEQAVQERTIQFFGTFLAFWGARGAAAQYDIMQGHEVTGVEFLPLLSIFRVDISA